jgi:hypothetical protein
MQAKCDMAVRCKAALAQHPAASAEAVQQQVLAGQRLGGSSGAIYSLQQLQGEAGFLHCQMSALQQVCGGHQLVVASSSLVWLPVTSRPRAHTAAHQHARHTPVGSLPLPKRPRARVAWRSATRACILAWMLGRLAP